MIDDLEYTAKVFRESFSLLGNYYRPRVLHPSIPITKGAMGTSQEDQEGENEYQAMALTYTQGMRVTRTLTLS